jgi:hypothetical protein
MLNTYDNIHLFATEITVHIKLTTTYHLTEINKLHYNFDMSKDK